MAAPLHHAAPLQADQLEAVLLEALFHVHALWLWGPSEAWKVLGYLCWLRYTACNASLEHGGDTVQCVSIGFKTGNRKCEVSVTIHTGAFLEGTQQRKDTQLDSVRKDVNA